LKGAIVNLTRELAVQWAARGVRVNCIAPGWFPSELTADKLEDDKSIRWLERKTPLRRAGRAGELDGALLLLAGAAGSFITRPYDYRRRRLDGALTPGRRRRSRPGPR
jgi:NAD(P)-dependent dehydrogenase (short-subunit alcohol dehydrogenase family)